MLYIYILYIYIYVSYNINKMHTMVKWNSPNLLSTQLLVNVQRDVISQKPIEWSLNRMLHQFHHLAVCQNLVPRVNIKIAGKWMFIPLKMVLIGIAPYPFWYLPSGKHTKNDGKSLENHHFNGKIHYKWAIFHSYVSLPEGTPGCKLMRIDAKKIDCLG